MSTSWYLMDTGHDYYGRFEKDEFGDSANDRFSELLCVSPEAYKIKINDNDTIAIIQARKELNNEKRMLTKIGEVKTGDLVTYKEQPWLVVTYVDDNGIYEYSTIKKCNHDLKFQLSTPEIFTVPCVIQNRTTYRDGFEYNKYITLATGQLDVTISANELTKQIKVNKRFIIGNEVWKVIFVDSLSIPGVIQITIDKDEIQADDNFDVGIANYIEGESNEDSGNDVDIPVNDYYVKIIGIDTLRQNQMSTYTIELYQGELKIEDELLNVEYKVYDETKENIAVIAKIESQNGINCTIKNLNAKNGYIWLQATVKINDDIIVGWKQIEMKALW